jgi:hypothetical protein
MVKTSIINPKYILEYGFNYILIFKYIYPKILRLFYCFEKSCVDKVNHENTRLGPIVFEENGRNSLFMFRFNCLICSMSKLLELPELKMVHFMVPLDKRN